LQQKTTRYRDHEMKFHIRLFLTLLLLFMVSTIEASHIAGAELVYSCNGNNNYRIRLKLYRDCLNGNQAAGYDDPLELYIFRSSDGSVYDTYFVPAPTSIPEIQPDNWNACVGTPYNICVQEGTYEVTVNLPPNAAGYDIGWTRCCRNNVITNFLNPECEGITFLAHVPGSAAATCNSMPEFNNTPSVFLCAGETYYFDYSATDVDGDSLAYAITTPFTGINSQGLGTGDGGLQPVCGSTLPPQLGPLNPMGPPPYNPVQYAPGHSASNPFGPGSFASINPTTGYLAAYPANNGIYVMCVSVREYRNGILLSENKRDFQFHVIACIPQGPPPILAHDLSGLNTNGDTILVLAGRPFCYDFSVLDTQMPSSIQVTPLSVSFGGNGGFPPPYATIQTNGTVPPVDGSICWRPSCDYVGNVVPMIISARDINDCPNYNIVFDTVWIRVLPPVPAPPVLTTSTGSLPMNGDTIILGVQENFCFNFELVDTFGGGDLVANCYLQDTLGNMLGQVQSVTTTQVGDTIFGEVCWETFCNFGRTYMFVIEGRDDYQCPPANIVRDTIFLRVPLPYNPLPLLQTDISQNPVNGDTILANVNESFCFDIAVLDTAVFAGQGVNFYVNIYDENWVQIINNPYSYSVTGNTDSISGEICWTPNCSNVDELVHLVVIGEQENACGLRTFDLDTIYVRVDEPFKPVPLISHDLGPNFPGNQQIDVSDDENFCFTFELRDTVTPALLIYGIDVFYANGAPFTGALPSLTYTTQSDTLLQGTICWTVPCELANQQFEIKMTGRDSFDCRLSNTVYDSVIISHTENPPAPLTFCNATVTDNDASIVLTWQANVETDVVGFVVYRRRDDQATFVAHDTLFAPLDSVYTDANAVLADEHSYCYQMAVLDRCGNTSPISEQICTVLLDAAPVDYTSSLNWTEFVGWGNGPVEYQIWRSSPITDGFGPTFLESLPPNQFSYVDPVVNKARLCYRIIAISDGTGCADQSQSNEVCVNFPPTLFVPTAFTPNHDGLNDFFSSFGEFVESFRLDIYDRWGKLLFRSENVNEGWDGNLEGLPVPEGVYVYRVKVMGYNGEEMEKEGSVTLIR
jgi:gliding motility-associated-like protein